MQESINHWKDDIKYGNIASNAVKRDQRIDSFDVRERMANSIAIDQKIKNEEAAKVYEANKRVQDYYETAVLGPKDPRKPKERQLYIRLQDGETEWITPINFKDGKILFVEDTLNEVDTNILLNHKHARSNLIIYPQTLGKGGKIRFNRVPRISDYENNLVYNAKGDDIDYTKTDYAILKYPEGDKNYFLCSHGIWNEIMGIDYRKDVEKHRLFRSVMSENKVELHVLPEFIHLEGVEYQELKGTVWDRENNLFDLKDLNEGEYKLKHPENVIGWAGYPKPEEITVPEEITEDLKAVLETMEDKQIKGEKQKQIIEAQKKVELLFKEKGLYDFNLTLLNKYLKELNLTGDQIIEYLDFLFYVNQEYDLVNQQDLLNFFLSIINIKHKNGKDINLFSKKYIIELQQKLQILTEGAGDYELTLEVLNNKILKESDLNYEILDEFLEFLLYVNSKYNVNQKDLYEIFTTMLDIKFKDGNIIGLPKKQKLIDVQQQLETINPIFDLVTFNSFLEEQKQHQRVEEILAILENQIQTLKTRRGGKKRKSRKNQKKSRKNQRKSGKNKKA